MPLVRVRHPLFSGLNGWLRSNEYQVDVSSGNAEVLVSNPDTLVAHIAGDVDRLLKAGRETCQNLSNVSALGKTSPAWGAIQAYYAAFYYVSAFLKLSSRNLAYVRTSDLQEIRRQIRAAPSGGPNIATGQWRFDLTPNAARVSIRKPINSDGVHEGTWKELRSLLETIEAGLSSLPFTLEERQQVGNEIGALARLTDGVLGTPFLSSTRNDIQYRQLLESWTPISKSNKSIDFKDLSSAIWKNESTATFQGDLGKTELEKFIRRCLNLCSVVHACVEFVSAKEPGSFLKSSYGKFHSSLM